MKPNEFLNQLQHTEIVAAITAAEARTSGEIRVCVSDKKVEAPIEAAQREFGLLGMERTAERNGVLIFVAPRTHKFAIIGDTGIHERCGDPFWRDVAAEMSGRFKQGEFTAGIVQAIQKAGEILAQHFPRKDGDKNELSDQIVSD